MNSPFRELPAWGISVILNVSVLALSHLIVTEIAGTTAQYELTTVVDETIAPESLQDYILDPTVTDQVGVAGGTQAMAGPGSFGGTGDLIAPTQMGPSSGGGPVVSGVDSDFGPTSGNGLRVSALGSHDIVVDVTSEDLGVRQSVGGGILSETSDPGSVEGALDRIALEIRQSLQERQTLVIFLLDASLSMEPKRIAIADRIDAIYGQLEQMGGTEGLHTAVASFGESSNLLTERPVQDPKVISQAVRAVVNDESGKENVFVTLGLLIEEFKMFGRHDGRWNRLVFIITDERGDDFDLLLEPTIEECLQYNFRCFVAGSAAVFGQQYGYVQYTYPEDGFVDYLPVDQGPETAFPQVLQMPFFGSGEDFRLQRMSAGYGPYALTRLCAETGGAYLITDDTQGFVFERDIMRLYGPDYRPSREQEQEIMSHPAKYALVQASAMTYTEGIPIPQTVFLHLNDNDLRRQLTDAQMPAARMDYQVNAILQILKQGEAARDSLEGEPRWAAAFDLAMGRAMAMRVRLYGYNLMLAQMKQTPLAFEDPANQNQWILVAGQEIDTGPQMRQAAEDARMYLRRVIDEHPDTPFARLAERELSTDMGWSWQPSYFPIPGLENRENLTEEEVMLLLAEELENQQRMRERERVNRTPPRL